MIIKFPKPNPEIDVEEPKFFKGALISLAIVAPFWLAIFWLVIYLIFC